MSTITSDVAISAGSTPNEPSRRIRTVTSVLDTSAAAPATRSTMPSNSTASSLDIDSVSCTRAIDATRRTDSSSAALAAGMPTRRACRRSRAATVCRLFFTRWWISRMVASLVISARSRRRTSVMSRTSTSAPIGTPAGISGNARCSTVAPRASTSLRAGASPRSEASDPVGGVGALQRVVGQPA